MVIFAMASDRGLVAVRVCDVVLQVRYRVSDVIHLRV